MDLVSIGEFARLARLSPKALRLYDQSGLLPPAKVDAATGYRWYATGQLETARLIAALRQLDMPLAQIGPLLPLDAATRTERIAGWWIGVEAEHAARRQLADYLADRLSGRMDTMSAKTEVTVRDLPARPMLCLMRHVRGDELLPVGREFLLKFRSASVRPGPGAGGAPFVIYYGEVNEDSDGPIEWCWPVSEEQAETLATQFPELTLRTDPAHQEAFIHQGPALQVGKAGAAVAVESLMSWASEQQRRVSGGVRMVYLSNPANGDSGPDCDLAIALR